MENELPGAWGAALGPKGVHSYSDLAAKTGVSKATAHRLVTGGATSAETVNKVADELFEGDRDAVWRLRGEERHDYGDWSLPAEASLLNTDQRDAILRLIQVMVPSEASDSDAARRASAEVVRRRLVLHRANEARAFDRERQRAESSESSDQAPSLGAVAKEGDVEEWTEFD